MKHIRIALLVALLLAVFPTAQAIACQEAECQACPQMEGTCQTVHLTTLVGDVSAMGIRTLATGLKYGAHMFAALPDEVRHQVALASPQVRSSVHTVANRAGDMVQQLSVEVTSLSLQLLRNVFSSFWAFVSGLLLS